MHSNPHALSPNRHVEHALDHARRLSKPLPRGQYTPAWWAEATHAGDLTALAALTLARSPRG
jgi:hypothetical protein